MPKVHADLRIEARYIVPMTTHGIVLEEHCIVVRDGRILDVLPIRETADRYSAAAVLQRPEHAIFPGLINANADAALSPMRDGLTRNASRDELLLAIGRMLKGGSTCFCDRFGNSELTAAMASEQGIRAVVGLPVARDLTQALRLRDVYMDRPLVRTVFAAPSAEELDEAALARLITLTDELDAVMLIDLHRSTGEVDRCVAAHGKRPIEWLHERGALTPTLSAVYASTLNSADIEAARQSGMTVIACPQATLKSGDGIPALRALADAGIRVALGSASAEHLSLDLWGDLRLAGLASGSPWDALYAATRGGAEVLNLDAHIGSVTSGQWADLCCVSLVGTDVQEAGQLVAALVLRGGRDWVTDVWVAGRQLLSDGELTRLDWRSLLAANQLRVEAASLKVHT